ncbi:MAG: sigma-70 family RNA polymerase sigma factor, partial [Proteobacteria bacterium]|nr:sigma-70 family RNA polymerase sigma factor [Pseudomonadota bacterium]
MAKKKSSPSSPKKSKKTVQPAKAVKVTVVDDDEIQPVPPDVELETSDIDENPHQEERALALPSDRSITTSDPVQLYLAEIRKYPLLTKEQEAELAKKYYETKDPKAAQALVTANLRFVVKVAAEYSKFGARLIDLIQEGNMGLMHAVREFNPYKGVRLITYAVWWIRGYIQEYLMKQYSLVP